MSEFSLEAVISGDQQEPSPMMRLHDVIETCRQAWICHEQLKLTATQRERLVVYMGRAQDMLRSVQARPISCGVVSVQHDHCDTKLRGWLEAAPGRRCQVVYINKEWRCSLSFGDGSGTTAYSTSGMLDAIDNALRAVHGSDSE